ncbi:hypothetical protein [Mucilaginibacter xinganensis]|nr:hypothetical protein [Mucilaginibacter xinganensis]
METEYTISTGSKIFNSILGTLMIFFSLFLFKISNLQAGAQQLIFILPILLLVGGILILINQFKAKIVIYDDRIRKVNVFTNKELLFSDVKGIRVGSKLILIESFTEYKLSIKNYSEFAGSEQVVDWLIENFTNLDKADLAEEKLLFLKDPDFGSTENEHDEKLKRARQVAIIYNVAGAVIGLPMIIFESPVLTALSLIYPLLGIVVMKFSGGLIKFISNKKRSVYPWVMFGFYIPALTLFIKGLLEFDILRYGHVWIIAVPIGVIVFFLLYATGFNKNTDAVKGQVIFMIVLSCFYGYGSTIQVNCEMDKAPPTLIHTKVYNKYTEYNKRTHYHFKLVSWDDDPAPKDIEVSQARFNRYLEGDGIEVYLRKGFLNIPWYTLSR